MDVCDNEAASYSTSQSCASRRNSRSSSATAETVGEDVATQSISSLSSTSSTISSVRKINRKKRDGDDSTERSLKAIEQYFNVKRQRIEDVSTPSASTSDNEAHVLGQHVAIQYAKIKSASVRIETMNKIHSALADGLINDVVADQSKAAAQYFIMNDDGSLIQFQPQ